MKEDLKYSVLQSCILFRGIQLSEAADYYHDITIPSPSNSCLETHLYSARTNESY